MSATPISQMSSNQLATLIVDALVDAQVVAKTDFAAAVEVATVEIDVRNPQSPTSQIISRGRGRWGIRWCPNMWAQVVVVTQPSNNRFERSRVSSSVSHGGRSMMGIKQLRWPSTQPRVAQPHR